MFVTRTQCPACASKQFDTLTDIPFSDTRLAGFLVRFYQSRINLTSLSDNNYTLCECQNCRLLFQQHILNDYGMGKLYNEWISASASVKKRQQGKAKIFRKYASEVETINRIIKKPPHEVSVLEFGMGWGYWSRMAAAFNFKVTGVELSPERIRHAEALGVKVTTELADIPPQSIDFIYTNQVLEHIPEPGKILRQLHNLLPIGGVILIRVPDGSGVSSNIKKQGWKPEMNAVHPLEHINTFTRSALVKFGLANGFEPLRPPFRLSCHNPSHFLRSVKREFSDRYRAPHVYFKKVRQEPVQ